MNTIPIADLSPGEAVLSADAVARHRATLDAGQTLEPVEIYKIKDRKIVRNGNNRVRAYVDHCRALGNDVGSIPCVPSRAHQPGPAALGGLLTVSGHYGTGPRAFEAIPVASRNQYERMQTDVARKIYRESPKP